VYPVNAVESAPRPEEAQWTRPPSRTTTSSPSTAASGPAGPRRRPTRTQPTPTQTTRTPTLTTPTPTQTRKTPASDRALLRAIEPVDAQHFLADYWETKPLHVARGEAGRFDDLFSARDADRLISEPGLRHPGFRLVKAGARLELRNYSTDIPWRPEAFTGVADVPRVLDEVEAGATVVLQGLHLTERRLAAYSRELEARLGHPAQANAYYTPRGSQGLAVHHDTHDVFVLQIAGTKRWLVYDPVLELPLRDQRYGPELGAPGDVLLDVVLGPGDTLYLPRGWLHEALTSEEDSLHLTIGVNVVTWLDALRAALERCAGDVAFRRSVPDDGSGGEELLELLAARLEPGEVAAARRERFVGTRRPVREAGIAELRALDALTASTPLERRPTVIADLVEGGDSRLALVFEGKRLVFPAHAREELEHAVGTDRPFTSDGLPGSLDEAGRLVLVRRLAREGFLRPVT
jgi:lysine-specific demethylase/histidyl-hydroxylase NO66